MLFFIPHFLINTQANHIHLRNFFFLKLENKQNIKTINFYSKQINCNSLVAGNSIQFWEKNGLKYLYALFK